MILSLSLCLTMHMALALAQTLALALALTLNLDLSRGFTIFFSPSLFLTQFFGSRAAALSLIILHLFNLDCISNFVSNSYYSTDLDTYSNSGSFRALAHHLFLFFFSSSSFLKLLSPRG